VTKENESILNFKIKMEIKILSTRDPRKVFEQEDNHVLYNLGLMFLHGKRVQQNYTKAAKWFRKAAERGNIAAMYQLGEMYRCGEGVPQDDTEAIQWFRQAGENEDEITMLMNKIK